MARCPPVLTDLMPGGPAAGAAAGAGFGGAIWGAGLGATGGAGLAGWGVMRGACTVVCGAPWPSAVKRTGHRSAGAGHWTAGKGQATLCVQSAQYRTRSSEIAFLRTVLV